MSQSQPEGPIWASLSLVKFSCVTYPSNSICPTWNHLTSNNLKLVIQTLRVVDENGTYSQRVMMRVFKGAETLVSQDLERLVKIRQHDASMVEVAQNSPRIAMRYPMGEGITQKFEMRFGSNEEFTTVVNIMSSLGLPVREGGPSQKQVLPIQRPQESPSPAPLTIMSSSPVTATDSHSRPTSVSSDIIHDRFSTRATLPPYAEFKVPGRPATVESMRQRPGSSQLAPGALDSFASSISLSSPSQSRATSFREPARQLYLSQLERESYNRRPSQPLTHENASKSISRQATSSFFLSQLQLQQEDDAESSASGSRLFPKSPFFSTLPGHTINRFEDPFPADTMPDSQEDSREHIMKPARRDLSFSRPSSTSAEPQDLIIPPRRQLPFDRPASTPADLQGLTVPPRRELPFSPPDPTPRSSSAADLPPLPKPTPVTKSIPVKPADVGSSRELANVAPIKRVAQRKAPAPKSANPRAVSPLKTLTRETTITPPTRDEDTPSPLATKCAAASRPASAASGLVSKASVPTTKRVATPIRPPSSTKRPKMIDQSTQTQTMSGRDHTVKERAPTSSSVPEDTPAVTTPAVAAAAPPQSFLNDLDAFVSTHKERPAPKELWQRTGYAEADADRRQMMLNDFICQNLENADFLQLCADTEVAWRRIGLGM